MAILQNKFVREDGSIVGSSVIISCKYTSDVNSQTNLTVGDVTADEVEVEIRTPAVSITAGEKLTYYQIEDGVENLIGVFYAEAPTVATKTSIRFKAYDGKAKLTTDFSEWLNANQDKFPMSLRTLVGYSCEVAGVPLAADSFQFDSLSIPAFYAQGVTCRQIVSWAAQISGCFVSCNTAGEIFFDWYRETSVWVSAKRTSVSSDYSFSIENGCLILSYHGVMPQYSIDESGCLILECSGEEPSVHIDENGYLVQSEQVTHQYRLDSLSKKNYSTDTIRRVQFKQETNDVGVIYPADADGNVFSISRNGIAAVLDSDTLRTIAQSLYEKLKSVSYVPLSFKLSRTASIRAGDIVSVTDGNGNTVSTYAMKVYLDSSGTQISSTGDRNYADKAAVSSEQYRNIPGKVLLLEKSVDGLRVENRDMKGNFAVLELAVGGISTRVETLDGNYSALKQTVDGLLADVGTGAGDLTSLSIRVGAVETKVQTHDGQISTLTHTIDGLTITDSGGTTKINGSSVETENLHVKAANIDGTLSADRIKSGTLTSSCIEIPYSYQRGDVSNGTVLDGGRLGFFEEGAGVVFRKKGIYFRNGAVESRAIELDVSGCILQGTTVVDGTIKTKTGGISATDDKISFSNGAFIVVYPNNMYMGGLWTIGSGEAVTSDAGKKHEIVDLDERYNTLFDLIRPVAFKYNDGTSGRYHTGFIANEVEDALEKAGISTQEFAGFVTIDEENEDGTTTKTRCLRYEEFIAVLWGKVKQLEKRLEALA